MILTINGKQAALKKESSIEYVSENRIFTNGKVDLVKLKPIVFDAAGGAAGIYVFAQSEPYALGNFDHVVSQPAPKPTMYEVSGSHRCESLISTFGGIATPKKLPSVGFNIAILTKKKRKLL